MTERLNDLDLLGPPRSCRRLPLGVWLWVVAALVIGAAVATVLKAVG